MSDAFTFVAPAVLALSTSLLATSLSRSECRKHLAVFSVSTPFGALFSYALMSLVRINSEGNWTGIAMLVSVRYQYSFYYPSFFT